MPEEKCTSDRNQICQDINGVCTCYPIHITQKISFPRLWLQMAVLFTIAIVLSTIGALFFGYTYMYLAICLWLFGAAVTTPLYPENYVNNSSIIASTIPMIFLTLEEVGTVPLDVIGILLHIAVLAIAFILLFLNQPTSMILIGIFSGIGIVWFGLVRDLIYPTQPSLLVFIAATIINIFVILLIQRYRRTRNS